MGNDMETSELLSPALVYHCQITCFKAEDCSDLLRINHIFANMKFRSVIAYCILAVYSLTLVHTAIPHDHHVHDYLNKVVAVFNHADDHHHHDGSDHHHGQEQEHNDHQLPHHEESQHPDNYTLSGNTTSNLLLQLSLLTAYCCTPTFALSPTVTDIDEQDIYYIPLKIPIQFSSAVPLRAPPVV